MQRLAQSNVPLVVGLALIVAMTIAEISAAGIYIDSYFLDLLVTLDASWRGYAGQVPHLDFHTPIGQVYFWPYWLVGLLAAPSTKAILWANLLVAYVATLPALLLLRRRLSPWTLVLVCLLIFTVALSPRQSGTLSTYSHLAPYNQWSWSLILLFTTIVFAPRPQGSRPEWSETVALGVLLFLLLYLKVTYFIVAAGLLFAGSLLGACPWSLIVRVVPVVVVGMVAVEVFAGNTLAYLSDIRSAADVGKGSSRGLVYVSKLLRHIAEGAVYELAICLILWLRGSFAGPIDFIRKEWCELAIGTVIILAGITIALQNHPRIEVPLFVAALLLVYARGEDRAGQALPTSRSVASSMLAIGLAGLTIFLNVGAVLSHSVMSHSAKSRALASFADTPFSDLRVPQNTYDRAMKPAPGLDWKPVEDWDPFNPAFWEMRESYYLRRTSEALRLVHPYLGPKDTLFALEFANPFSALTGTRPVPHSLLWWHEGRTFSKDIHPTPDALLDGVTLVLVTKANPFFSQTEAMWDIYGRAIEKSFARVAESDQWQLWKRKND